MFDWGFAGQVAGVGFGMVLTILVLLAVVVWVVGMVVRKIEKKAGTDGSED